MSIAFSTTIALNIAIPAASIYQIHRKERGWTYLGPMSSMMIRKPIRERTKNISKLTCRARSMKTEINVSQTARATMAICSFLIRIPAQETLSVFWIYVPASFKSVVSDIIKQKHHKGINIIKIPEFEKCDKKRKDGQ